MASRSPLPSVRPSTRRGIAALLVSALTLALAGQAVAGPTQQSIFQDDRILFDEGPVRQAAALDEMAALGADVVHANVYWHEYAPEPDSSEPPEGFDASDPASYPPNPFDRLDELVRGADARGIALLLSPTGPAPAWASDCTASEARRLRSVVGACRPDPDAYRAFVTALGRRYSGAYLDENGPVLPAVRSWSVWNEPNLASWLAPQLERVRRRKVATGAVIYRALVRGATAGLRASGHARDRVLVGETSPIGGSSIRTAPVDFYLALFCMDETGRRFRGADAANHDCRTRRRLDVDGAAHHPYTRGAGEPLLKRQRADSITMANVDRLERVLRLGARNRMVPAGVRRQIYFTEFGVSSRPPGRRLSVPLGTQAEYINHFDYLAYREPAVRGVSQFGLEDDPHITTFQTGLRFAHGGPKPSYTAYRLPLYVVRAGSRLRVFGQVRGDGNGERVQVQNRGRRGGFRTVRTVRTRRGGFLLTTLAPRPGTWRLVWDPPGDAPPVHSRVARVRSR